MKNDDFAWLIEWYDSQCDGDWEHENGIQINTLDNPGWVLKVGLNETELQNKTFKKIKIDRSDTDWLCCFVEDNIYSMVLEVYIIYLKC